MKTEKKIYFVSAKEGAKLPLLYDKNKII